MSSISYNLNLSVGSKKISKKFQMVKLRIVAKFSNFVEMEEHHISYHKNYVCGSKILCQLPAFWSFKKLYVLVPWLWRKNLKTGVIQQKWPKLNINCVTWARKGQGWDCHQDPEIPKFHPPKKLFQASKNHENLYLCSKDPK